MKHRTLRIALVVGAVLTAMTSTASEDSISGPSSSQTRYIVRSQLGVVVKSILTV